jgi:hypothetical protein
MSLLRVLVWSSMELPEQAGREQGVHAHKKAGTQSGVHVRHTKWCACAAHKVVCMCADPVLQVP